MDLVTVEIHDPDKPGDTLVINAGDFIEGTHRLASEPLVEKKAAAKPKKDVAES